MAYVSGTHRGFTYLELLVVVSILAVLTAAIVPLYSISVRSLQQRSVRGDFVATIYFLQELSIQQSRELRLHIDPEENAWSVTGWVSGMGEDKVFEPLAFQALGEPHPFPEAMPVQRLRGTRAQGQSARHLTFYPNGACDRVAIRFGPPNSTRPLMTIETTGTLGGVVVSP